MKQFNFLFLFLALQTTGLKAQTIFDWETLSVPSSGTSISETRDGITVTFANSDSSNNVVAYPNLSYGGSGNCVFTNNTTSVIFSFDAAVNIISIIAMDAENTSSSYTFTPTSGSNTPVVANLTNHAAEVELNWTGVTSFTVTPENMTDMIFDDLVVTTEALSIPNVSVEKVTIYPNPTASNLYIKGVTDIMATEVYNSLGQLVLRNAASEIHVEALSPGVYILKVTTDKGNFTKQFVKE